VRCDAQRGARAKKENPDIPPVAALAKFMNAWGICRTRGQKHSMENQQSETLLNVKNHNTPQVFSFEDSISFEKMCLFMEKIKTRFVNCAVSSLV